MNQTSNQDVKPSQILLGCGNTVVTLGDLSRTPYGTTPDGGDLSRRSGTYVSAQIQWPAIVNGFRISDDLATDQ
jgi:hypothetical protein